MKMLITGGRVFVSKFTAEYFACSGHEVYVINRGSRPQPAGVTLINSDRHSLGGSLKGMYFDAVLPDICVYNEKDISRLLEALNSYNDCIFISLSAVYPETLKQPFNERQRTGGNKIWGAYGAGKRAAEEYLLQHDRQAYILRPPCLYGPMQNPYRGPFVFDCAELKRKFYIPQKGEMKLQLFCIRPLCFYRKTFDPASGAENIQR